MAGTAGTVLPWMLLLMASSAAAAVQLRVDYPEAGNYSHVKLSCTQESSFGSADQLRMDQRPATFLRNDSRLSADDFVFLSVSEVEAEIVFTAEQEGEFVCRTGGTAPVENSTILYLAASPAINDVMRYFIIDTPDEPVYLPCAIQPGALAEKYSITSWTRTSATGEVTIINGTFAIRPVVSPGEPTQFICRVAIEHNNFGTGETEEYNGPTVTVNTAVLSYLANNAVPDVSVELGTPADLTCSFIRENTDFTILWMINRTEITCDTNSNVQCTIHDGENQSVLQIENTNTTLLGLGRHEVQCVMRNMIADEYRNDMSFNALSVEENFTATATLEILPTTTPSPTSTPSLTSTPSTPNSSDGLTIAVATSASIGGIVLAVVIFVVVIICCCCLRANGSDPDNKRRFTWRPRKHRHEEEKIIMSVVPPDPHVSPNKQFHAGNTPVLMRQNAHNSAHNMTLDVAGEDIYNGGSMMSGKSGISGLSEDDSMSCPPSPAVSSYQGDEDLEKAKFAAEDYPGRYGGSHPERNIGAPIIAVNETALGNGGTRFVDGRGADHSMEDHHWRQTSTLSHAPSSHYTLSQTSYSGIPNLFGELSQPDYHRGYHDPTMSLGVPNFGERKVGSNHSVHSEPITGWSGHYNGWGHRLDVHSERGGRSVSPHHDKHRRQRSPSSHRSDQSGYHSDYIDGGHRRHRHHHHDNHHRSSKSHSKSRSRSPKFPSHQGHETSSLGVAPQYRSHHTIPREMMAPIPMRQSRSDDFCRSATSRPHPPRDLQLQRPPSPPLSDTESWVKSAQRLHAHETQSLRTQSTPFIQSSSDSDPDSSPHEPGPGERERGTEGGVPAGAEIMDSILLEAVGCLMHQENCRIPNCPCRQVKQRFQHIMPQTRLRMQQEAERVIQDAQSGRLDPSDRRQQMRISLSSQNFSPDIHAHYHMTSRSHLRQSGGGGASYRSKFMQRRRSKSMDLTPVMEQPGESCATTPSVVIPDSARGLLCGPAFSPAITPAGETVRILSPTTPAAHPVAPPVLLREISLSADNIPSLCLNDCPMAATPLMHLANRPLGSNIRSPLSVVQQRWVPPGDHYNVGVKPPLPRQPEQPDSQKESPSSDEGHVSDRYTSQESSSSLQTNSTHSSSGKTDHTSSVFDESASNQNFEGQFSIASSTTTNGSLRRQHFVAKGKQEEVDKPPNYCHSDSGYRTNSEANDPELSLRSRVPPSDLPLSSSPNHRPATVVTKALPFQQSSNEPSRHLVPVATSNQNGTQRRGSTSSYGSHHSSASYNSHVSMTADGNLVTQTLC